MVFVKISLLLIHTLIENIQSALGNNKFSCGIFIDLEKVFDTVDHNILLSKLNYYGIRGIANDWFKSYLSNRSQFVSINGFNSDHQNIECGVPQGSVLRPLLFLNFINYLNFATRSSSTLHFADDTCFLNIKSTIKEISKYVNKALRSLSKSSRLIHVFLNILTFRSYQKSIIRTIEDSYKSIIYV